ncbi:MAG: glycosyltransferase family 4 protein [Deltaproteobacteria bacterium]|nr:glycosyltransferase family 4 protein [Deltaproteobacteria bacterium]
MKVLMIAPDIFMIDRRIILEAESLIKFGHTVTLLSGFECKKEEHYIERGINIHRYVYDWDDYRLKIIRKFLPDKNIIRYLINRGFIIFANRFLTLSPFERFIFEKASQFEFDIIHCHDLPVLKPAIVLSALRNVPLIYDAHEIYPSQKVLPLRLRIRSYLNEKLYVKYADYVITVNEFIADIMRKRYGISDIGVIMNCAKSDNGFDPNSYRGLLREKLKLKKDDRIVLFQGWISQERNLDAIVRAFKYVGEKIKLVIIGYGPYEERLREIVKKERLKRRVFFFGSVPSDEILKYTSGADIGIIPYEPIDENHLYCSPNKFFEFIISGVPVISNDLPFFKKMNEKYGVGVTADMKRPLELAKVLKSIIDDEIRLGALRENALKAASELNWDVEEKKLFEIYNKVLELHKEKSGMKRRRFFYLPFFAMLGTYLACKGGPEIELTPNQNSYKVGDEVEIMVRYLPPSQPEVEFWVKRNPEDWVKVREYSKNPVIKYKFTQAGDYAFEVHIKDGKSPQGFRALWKGVYTVTF